MYRAIFINHSEERCGVYQFGDVIADALRKYSSGDWLYAKTTNSQTVSEYIKEFDPDVVIYNYHPAVSTVAAETIDKVSCPTIGIVHEKSWFETDNFLNKFDYLLAPDITYPKSDRIFTTNRTITDFYQDFFIHPTVPTFGTFGFAFGGKGYERLITQVQSEYDEAKIRLHIPYARFGDNEGNNAQSTVESCKALVTKSGIKLEFTHDFLNVHDLCEWLSRNTINCFFYDEYPDRGISSAVDFALAVKRPIAISNSNMFRHIKTNPSIRIEDRSLRDIISSDIYPLIPLYAWNEKNTAREYDAICKIILNDSRN